jgi:hypothetical protein
MQLCDKRFELLKRDFMFSIPLKTQRNKQTNMKSKGKKKSDMESHLIHMQISIPHLPNRLSGFPKSRCSSLARNVCPHGSWALVASRSCASSFTSRALLKSRSNVLNAISNPASDIQRIVDRNRYSVGHIPNKIFLAFKINKSRTGIIGQSCVGRVECSPPKEINPSESESMSWTRSSSDWVSERGGGAGDGKVCFSMFKYRKNSKHD